MLITRGIHMLAHVHLIAVVLLFVFWDRALEEEVANRRRLLKGHVVSLLVHRCGVTCCSPDPRLLLHFFEGVGISLGRELDCSLAATEITFMLALLSFNASVCDISMLRITDFVLPISCITAMVVSI